VVPGRGAQPRLEPLTLPLPAGSVPLPGPDRHQPEYFHGDNGAALGAWHQTGWTGLIADVIRRRYGLVRSSAEIVRIVEQENRP
jgi:hypothetical protein